MLSIKTTNLIEQYFDKKSSARAIAIDYHGTYTTDPKMWLTFVKMALAAGFEVYCVTEGDEGDYEIDPDLSDAVTIIWCDGQPKEKVTKDKGVDINIWIDNHPDRIIEGQTEKL